jgi:uncharacterized protein (DUF1015 family)
MRIRPLRVLRPAPEVADRVASPPYDVVSRGEATAMAKGNPLSFLHVVRSEIDLPDDVDARDPRVYTAARANLERLIAEGALGRDESPALFVYREVMDGHAQVGLVAGLHVDDYERNVIRRHETTRPDKEDDRTRHILSLGAQAEPVLVAYRGRPEIDRLVAAALAHRPLYDFVAEDGVRHSVWPLAAPRPYVEAFADVPCAYIADGHHRSAAAWRAAHDRRTGNRAHRGDEEYEWFLAVLVPASQLTILPYNRLVSDLGGQTVGEVLERLGNVGRLAPTEEPAPLRPGSFGVYAKGRWRVLELAEGSIDRRDPIRSLDVSLLQDRILGPVLGIEDQRTDKRIDFVGGIHGTRALEARVDSGEAALAFSLNRTTLDQLMTVADAGHVMPPKSTWFEPKLRSGLFVHPLD